MLALCLSTQTGSGGKWFTDMQALDKISSVEELGTGSTPRIDRRRTVLAQIEAALLADKMGVLELAGESTGTDPYNRGRARATVWSPGRRG